jgi:hypothetical protein
VTEPFTRSGSIVEVRLSDGEISVLADLPELIAREGDADGRLAYVAHADDEGAEERYRELIGDDLDRLRAADRSTFTKALGTSSLTLEEAEAWMRVIGEARIVLAGRLGITEDGWEEEAAATRDPEMALLGYLGYLQEGLIGALS